MIEKLKEYQNKVKKLQKSQYMADPRVYLYDINNLTQEIRKSIDTSEGTEDTVLADISKIRIIDSIGWVLFCLSNIADELGISLEETADRNIIKIIEQLNRKGKKDNGENEGKGERPKG